MKFSGIMSEYRKNAWEDNVIMKPKTIEKIFNAEEEKLDERQKAVSGEIGRKAMQLWYVLNFAATCVFGFIIAFNENMLVSKTFAVTTVLCFFAITLVCLSFYNIRTAQLGVFTSFTGYKQKKERPFASAILLVMMLIYNCEKLNWSGSQTAFWIVLAAMAMVFDTMTLLCKRHNAKVISSQLEEE